MEESFNQSGNDPALDELFVYSEQLMNSMIKVFKSPPVYLAPPHTPQHFKKEQLCIKILTAAPVTEKVLETWIPPQIFPIP